MAINTGAPYSGAVQRFTDLTSSAADVGVVVGGNYDIDGKLTTTPGASGQNAAHSDIVVATASVDLQDPVKALLVWAVRATSASSVTAKNFGLGNTDSHWLYTACQPGSLVCKCGVGQPFVSTLQVMAQTPSQVISDPTQPAAGSRLAEAWQTLDVAVDGADYACQSFEFNLNNNPFACSSMDTRTTGSKRIPVAIRLGIPTVTLTLECEKQMAVASSSIIADSPDVDIDVVITGTGVTFTLSDLLTPSESGPLLAANGAVVWRYTFPCNAPFQTFIA